MTTKPPIEPVKAMSRQAIRRVLEADREEIVRQIHSKAGDIQSLYALLSTNTTLWEATQPDEAPEFEATISVRKAS